MFSRNEKWIGNPPTVNHKAWKTREDEVLGFTSYLQELSSWASQGSVKFGREIELSSRWIDPIIWSRLSNEQQNRAVRLQALLASAFSEHGRISLMVQGFQEGLDISPEFDSRASEPYGNRNGFELLRQGSDVQLAAKSVGNNHLNPFAELPKFGFEARALAILSDTIFPRSDPFENKGVFAVACAFGVA